jgi:excisionase family DNA binding protein
VLVPGPTGHRRQRRLEHRRATADHALSGEPDGKPVDETNSAPPANATLCVTIRIQTTLCTSEREDAMVGERFLTLSDVAEILNISASQTYALVRSGALPAIKIGGRGQWRVERTQLETYIERMYDETRRFVEAHPLGRDEPLPPD